MLAKQPRFLLGGDVQRAVVFPGHRPAHPRIYRVVTLLEHFPHQPQRGQRLGQKRDAVEEQRIAPRYIDRQDRRAGRRGDFDETGVPQAILHALDPKTRHFPRRKDNQRSLLLEVVANAPQVLPRGAAAHIGHRQQHRLKRCYRGEQIIGDDFDIGPNLTHQAQQRQAIQ